MIKTVTDESIVSYLDKIAAIPQFLRQTYGDDPDQKPNDHCNWVNVGYTQPIWVWEENDDHFRNRIKQSLISNYCQTVRKLAIEAGAHVNIVAHVQDSQLQRFHDSGFSSEYVAETMAESIRTGKFNQFLDS